MEALHLLNIIFRDDSGILGNISMQLTYTEVVEYLGELRSWGYTDVVITRGQEVVYGDKMFVEGIVW